MSDEELVGAYMDGRISRRTLIRRLVAAGVSLGAATAYAHHLAPQADAGGLPSEYPVVRLRILTDEISEALKDDGVEVRVKCDEDAKLFLTLSVEVGGNFVPVGDKTVRFPNGGGKKTVLIRLDDKGPLRNRRQAEVRVDATFDHGIYQPTVAVKTKTLTK
jgi:hypothetical protein